MKKETKILLAIVLITVIVGIIMPIYNNNKKEKEMMENISNGFNEFIENTQGGNENE